jgi:hypothetical protein
MMEHPWDSKPSKIQTFFQISITALAFLAFAGYLLCMIVQAIKAKRKSTQSLPRVQSDHAEVQVSHVRKRPEIRNSKLRAQFEAAKFHRQ